jgi:DNA-binding HxlR family transcriptional regulator/peroxiredoxin
MRRVSMSDADCAIAQALDVVGDWWTLLIVRDVARGVQRFDALQTELNISRRALTERLTTLLDHDVLRKEQYSDRPPRHEYLLTPLGRGLLPVLVALQDWGATWVLGDGMASATSDEGSAEAHRVRNLVGQKVPALSLGGVDPVADTRWTVLYCYPGTGPHPPNWSEIPGAPGCTLESCTYRDRLAEFAELDATVYGVSTQRADEQAEFARRESIQFSLLSDAELGLVAALRLPTFRAAGVDRVKRLTLVVDRDRVVRAVLYPVPDVTGSVQEALDLVKQLTPCGGVSALSERDARPGSAPERNHRRSAG